MTLAALILPGPKRAKQPSAGNEKEENKKGEKAPSGTKAQ